MSARFELDRSVPSHNDGNLEPLSYVQVANQKNGSVENNAAASANTADKHLPTVHMTDSGRCRPETSGQPERKDFHDARQRLSKTYEDKFCRGQSVTLEYGATIWDVAQARLSAENGQKPSNQEIARESAAIMKELGISECGDTNIVGLTVRSKGGKCGSNPEPQGAYEADPPSHVREPNKAPDRHHGSDSGSGSGSGNGKHEPTDSGTSSPEIASAAGCTNERTSQHGRVEKNGNTTTIREDNGATQSIKTDDKGNPIEVNRQGGHWDDRSKLEKAAESALVGPIADSLFEHKQHFKKTGDHEWTADNGHKWHGDVSLGKDGTYSYTDLDKGLTRVFKPNGSRYHQTADGQKTFIQSADGANPHSYVRKDGHWQESPGGEKFDHVDISETGTVTARGNGVTKELRPDGSQVDTDDHGRRTFVQTPDGANQKSYIRDGATGQWHDSATKKEYADVQMDENGMIKLREK